MEWLIMLLLFVVLALAALRWGKDSRESANSNEWERRKIRNSFYSLPTHHL